MNPVIDQQLDRLKVKQEIERVTLEGIGEKDSEELKKKMLLLEMHKKNTMKHEPYLETNNKRPGPGLEVSE